MGQNNKLSKMLQAINDKTLSLLGIMSKNGLMAELESEEIQETLNSLPPRKKHSKQKRETKKTKGGLSPTNRTN